MLIEFSVKNFRSFRDEVTFSMLTNSSNENLNNVVENEDTKERYLKSSAIYGANASGKTNFNRAFTAAILMIRKSNARNVNEPLLEMNPFVFDTETIKKPCEFKFVFIKNNVKYIYGFSATQEKVYTEYLYQYLSAKPSLVFERNIENEREYKFSQAESGKLNELAKKNTEKKLFLSTATEWNYEKTRDAYLWFAEDIDVFDDNRMGYALDRFERDTDGELKKFTLEILKCADLYIKDYSFESKEIKNDLILFDNIKVEGAPIQKAAKISLFHEVEGKDGSVNNFELDMLMESFGTQNLFFLCPILKETFDKGKTIIIDEIDKSLHPFIVEFIIKLFHNKEINKNNAQLIFNTHDTNLLSLDIFRRDQIWFTEKDSKSGMTDLYPLDDFSVRKNENIQKGYLNGRYGAVPFLTLGNGLWVN